MLTEQGHLSGTCEDRISACIYVTKTNCKTKVCGTAYDDLSGRYYKARVTSLGECLLAI